MIYSLHNIVRSKYIVYIQNVSLSYLLDVSIYQFFVNCVSVEDVSDLWPTVKSGFEEQLPFKRASLNNKTRNSVFVENLTSEFILTTDSRLRSRFPLEQSLFWFREPYATVVLVTCEVTCCLIDLVCMF